MPSEPSFTITQVRTPSDLAACIALFEAYSISLGIDLSFQGFSNEMASMPGKYAPPRGELLLAKDKTGTPTGCVAMRPIPQHGDHVAEMKRLYVTPDGRGTGVGKALAMAITTLAESLGYTEVRLDTLATMASAIKLYEALGFVDIDPYYKTPIEGTRFLSLRLPRLAQ